MTKRFALLGSTLALLATLAAPPARAQTEPALAPKARTPTAPPAARLRLRPALPEGRRRLRGDHPAPPSRRSPVASSAASGSTPRCWPDAARHRHPGQRPPPRHRPPCTPHPFARLVPARTALLVIDMQRGHMDAEVGHSCVPAAPGIAPGTPGHACLPAPDIQATDGIVPKYRHSAFIPGASDLESRLRARGLDTLPIAGTRTNVCCESSARDAMMLNFRTIVLADASAAMTDAAHNALLVNFYLAFGDVQTVAEAEAALRHG